MIAEKQCLGLWSKFLTMLARQEEFGKVDRGCLFVFVAGVGNLRYSPVSSCPFESLLDYQVEEDGFMAGRGIILDRAMF